MATSVERRLAAILAADVAGYSRLMARDEDGTFARLRQLRIEMIEPMLARHGGRIVDLRGDGGLVEFRSTVAAVEAAINIQQAIERHESERPEPERIRLRMGINLGEVIVDGDAIYGDGVNVAARIECLCNPGGIWLTRAVRNEVAGKLDVELAPCGPYRMKNIGGAIELFRVTDFDGIAARAMAARLGKRGLRLAAAAACTAVLALGGGWWAWSAHSSTLQKPSVAVLPFADLGGDAAARRLADGITQDVVIDLARFRDLDVIAHTANPTDIKASGDRPVDYVLQGSIQRQGDRVRVSVRLADAKSETNVWSERWDRPMQDVFAVQTELAEQVASQLGGYGRIAEADQAAARRKQPSSLTAYDLYMLGVEAKHRMTPGGRAEAVQLLNRAIGLDPTLARAWTALSWAHSISAAADDPDPDKARSAALEAARRAVELDPADAEGYAALAVALGTRGDLAAAEPTFDNALRLNRNHPGVLAAYATWASSFGRAEDGADAADRLVRLDPGYPAWAADSIAFAYQMVGRYEDALHALSRVPEGVRSREHLIAEAVALAALGRDNAAKDAVDHAMARFPDISAEALVARPMFAESDRQRAVEALAAVGFPTCARIADLDRIGTSARLRQCDAERTALAGEKS